MDKQKYKSKAGDEMMCTVGIIEPQKKLVEYFEPGTENNTPYKQRQPGQPAEFTKVFKYQLRSTPIGWLGYKPNCNGDYGNNYSYQPA